MRQKNMRVVYTGVAMVVAALAFFVGMLSVAPRSTDPAALMQTVGTVSGAVGGLGIAMIIFGLIGRRSPS